MGSECSSGCESGWTLYLEEEYSINNASHRSPGSQFIGGVLDEFYGQDKARNEDLSGEEDLSMVSDASSGPPHFPDRDQSYFNASNNAAKLVKRSKKRQKVKENKHLEEDHEEHLPSFLDDTASSPLFDFSVNNITATNQQTSTESMLDYSQGFSATYFEERSSLQDHFRFLQPSLSENEAHNNNNNKWYAGKEVGMI